MGLSRRNKELRKGQFAVILETIISSLNEDETPNFAPIGVHIDDTAVFPVAEFAAYLYQGSKTYENVKRRAEGVVNFSNDLIAFVDSALYSKPLPAAESKIIRTPRMAQTQGCWEFTVRDFDDAKEPACIKGQIIHSQQGGSFSGFCRAHGAVLEALIAATRLRWITPEELQAKWPLWQEIVSKTGGCKEKAALDQIRTYLREQKFSVEGQQG